MLTTKIRPLRKPGARLWTRLYLTACLAVFLSAFVPALASAGTETTGSPPASPKMK